jgi:hypothetical protein
MIPSFVGLGRVQPERSQISLSFIIVMQLMFISIISSRFLLDEILSNKAQKLAVFISLIILLISTSNFTNDLAKDMYVVKNYSQKFDLMIQNFKQISSSDSQKEINVSLPDSGLVAKLLDPEGVYTYKNLSLSQYYKIGKVNTVKYEE